MTDHTPTSWDALAESTWRRRKWRRTDGTPETEQCFACKIPIHRKATYYLRPAYTDDRRWLCWRCYQKMIRAAGGLPDNRYSRRRGAG